MTTIEREPVGREFVSMQPTDEELFTSFLFYLTRPASGEVEQQGFSTDWGKFREGLKVATEKAPFLKRYIDQDSGTLSVVTADTLAKLLKEEILVRSFDEKGKELIKLNISKQDHVASVARSFFREQGVAVLKEAAEAARAVWAK